MKVENTNAKNVQPPHQRFPSYPSSQRIWWWGCEFVVIIRRARAGKWSLPHQNNLVSTPFDEDEAPFLCRERMYYHLTEKTGGVLILIQSQQRRVPPATPAWRLSLRCSQDRRILRCHHVNFGFIPVHEQLEKKIVWFAGCTLCLPWTLHLNLCYHRHHQNIPGDHVVDAIGWKTCQTFFLRSPSLRHHPLVLVYAAVRSPGDLCWVSIW